jgi:hypothetical protein
VNDPKTTSERVILTIPPHASWVRLARLTVAGVASRLGFGVDDVEALRIGIDELAMVLLDDADGDGDLTIIYEPSDAGLVVEGRRPRREGVTTPLDPPATIVAQILSTVVDEWQLAAVDGAATFRCHKRPETVVS